nr:MAG TPA: hypothetical protein [Herelleviridae sp.]
MISFALRLKTAKHNLYTRYPKYCFYILAVGLFFYVNILDNHAPVIYY